MISPTLYSDFCEICDNYYQMPTYKQKLVASKLVENGGYVGKAMVAAGYSSKTAKTPQKLTESKGWQELMKEYVSEVDVLKTHSLLLKAEKGSSYMFPKSEDDNVIKEIIESKSVFKLLYVRKTKTHYLCAPRRLKRMRAKRAVVSKLCEELL